MDTRRQIRLVALGAFVQALFYLRNILILPILTRALGPGGYGAWSKMQLLANLLAPVIGLGVIEGAVRYLPAAAPPVRRGIVLGALAALLLGGLLLTGALALAAPALAPVLDFGVAGAEARAILAAQGGLTLAVALILLCFHVFRLGERPAAYGVFVAMQLFAVVATAWLAWQALGTTLWVPLLAWGGVPGLIALVTLAALVLGKGLRHLRLGPVRRMVGYGLPLLPLPALFWLQHAADRYMIPWLRPELGNAAVGQYAANYAIAGLVPMAVSPFLVFFTREVTRLYDRGARTRAGRLTRQSTKAALVAAVPLVGLLPFAAGPVLRVVAGAGFEGMPLIVGAVAGAYLLFELGRFAEVPLAMQERTRRILLHVAAAAGANVGLNLVLIPRYGIGGAAGATVAGFGLYWLLNRLATRKGRSFQIRLRRLGPILLAGAACGACVRYAPAVFAFPLGRLAGAGVGLVLYAALLLLLRAVRPVEIALALGALRGIEPPPAPEEEPPPSAAPAGDEARQAIHHRQESRRMTRAGMTSLPPATPTHPTGEEIREAIHRRQESRRFLRKAQEETKPPGPQDPPEERNAP